MKLGRKDYDKAIFDERVSGVEGGGIPADEPVFLIRGQDMNGGDAVRVWARLAEERGADPTIIKAARLQACAMDEYNKEHVPDLPEELRSEFEPDEEDSN